MASSGASSKGVIIFADMRLDTGGLFKEELKTFKKQVPNGLQVIGILCILCI